MRYGVVRTLAGGAVALAASALLAGCGAYGGNSGQVCADAKKAFQQYVAQVRSIPAAEPAQWREATEELAGRIDALAKQADDEALKKTLQKEAADFRGAAPAVGAGDVSGLNTVIQQAPADLGEIC